MNKLLSGIKYDVNFIKSHKLQPRWYKVLKIFILLGLLVGYWVLFGFYKTVMFFAIFFSLTFLVHMLYRVKTNKYKQSWLDFKVVDRDGEIKPESVGIFYYSMIVFNAAISFLFSQLLP